MGDVEPEAEPVLRILLDATAIPADRRGVGRYLDGLVPALADAGTPMVVVCQPHDAELFAPYGEVVSPPANRIARRPVRLLWEQAGFPSLIKAHNVDLVHSPHYTMPVRSPVPVVVTLHDATFFTDPTVHTRVKAPFFRACTRIALRRAAACVVDSHATGDELVRVAGARREQLFVAHLGVDRVQFAAPSAAAVQAFRDRHQLGADPYVAFLGTMEPRKNLRALVTGFAAAAKGRQVSLVLAGGGGWDTELDRVIEELPEVRIVRPGYLPIDELPALLAGAAIVAYPSLDEGFGLPVLEAMSCGAAVLTTRRGALPEVGGDAVAYTDVDAASIGVALGELLDDEPRRSQLRAAGPARAAEFSWAACAEGHLRAFEAAVAR
ncbi:MAG: glycosyl transferase, group 1 [Pseudonocardiales bacterium]|nr:glycosyl transferase, group 1 [Pseudonocardiales bacterium]